MLLWYLGNTLGQLLSWYNRARAIYPSWKNGFEFGKYIKQRMTTLKEQLYHRINQAARAQIGQGSQF